ncbi:hypothetical protein [Polymorphobacter fuscus]|uniref:Uncharacterized protein n=1 Tax=Sandarakinorhabdus fusca TaxID=1439888 RepID=A0A7C9KHE2_9SPHN|nr:hypothetical protein [Polymorphobacter fuscus]KAB7648801.1 hypothetical protein F9290_03805 [Polymorphobacter fuscus]MQT16381.1 hypothetical protein [Polymorphobacter fuscus]NJC07330.1 hypothetical protein [Polymorphobacter fuscus]
MQRDDPDTPKLRDAVGTALSVAREILSTRWVPGVAAGPVDDMRRRHRELAQSLHCITIAAGAAGHWLARDVPDPAEATAALAVLVAAANRAGTLQPVPAEAANCAPGRDVIGRLVRLAPVIA